MKRDLKADLEYCKELEPISLKIKRHLIVALGRRAKGVTVFERWTLNAIDGWPHAIERAIKAEALARELVGVIDDLCRQINQCGLDEQMWEVYRTAKEVLGDDSQGDNRATQTAIQTT